MQIWDNHGLAEHTTMGIGGKARKFVEAESVQDIVDALQMAHADSVPVFILGAGSNTLIADEGFNGYSVTIPSRTCGTMRPRESSTVTTVT